MAKRKTMKRGNKIAGAVTAVVAALMLLITVSDSLGLPLPSWEEITGYLAPEDPSTGPVIPSGTNTGDDLASIHIIDVGQGDCVLIHTDEKNVLIDAGETDKGDDVAAYLQALGVRKLDLVIGTHPHSDHMGGMAAVLQAIPTEAVWTGDTPDALTPTSKFYTRFLTEVKTQKIPLRLAKPGDTFQLAQDVVLTVVGPHLGKQQIDNLNDVSVVCRLDAGERSFLFSGDAEKVSEEAILAAGENIDVDVMHLGHHGSSTSTSAAYLKAASPSYVSASMGKDNRYGHPHKETLQKVKDLPFYRTDLYGSIVFHTDGVHLTVQTETTPKGSEAA